MKKGMERTRETIFCRLPALLLCTLLLSACGSKDKAEAASGEPGESAVSVEDTGEAVSDPAASSEAQEGISSSEAQETASGQTSASQDRLDGIIEEIGSSSFRVSETITEDLGNSEFWLSLPADPQSDSFH